MRLNEIIEITPTTGQSPEIHRPFQLPPVGSDAELRTNFAIYDAAVLLLRALYRTVEYDPEFIQGVIDSIKLEADYLAKYGDESGLVMACDSSPCACSRSS